MVPTFYERMLQASSLGNYGPTPTMEPTETTPAEYRPYKPLDFTKKSFFWKMMDYLDRPRAGVSEAVQAGIHGENVLGGALAGLSGEAKYGTLGEAAFPEAAKPGFQAEDVAAFAIDVLTDPLTWLGPGAAKAVGKPLAKAGLSLGTRLLPTESKILMDLAGPLGSAVKQLPRSAKVRMVKSELEAIGLSAEEAFGRVWKLTTPENRDVLRRVSEEIAQKKGLAGDAVKLKSLVVKDVEEMSDEALSVFQDAIRDLQANVRPDARTTLQSLAQDFAKRALPAGKYLRNFGGEYGNRFAEGYKTALFNTDRRLTQWANRFKEYMALPGAKEEASRIASSAVREGLASPTNKNVAGLADNIGLMLDDFFKEVTSPDHLDEFGNGLMVWDEVTQTERPLAEAFVKNYWPRRLPAEAFTKKGQLALRKRLEAAGMESSQITDTINRIKSIQPKKVGHAEFARTGALEVYEQDPVKVLPKYFYDIVFRQELGKQFGMNNEVLTELSEGLIRNGFDENWVRKLSTQIIGRNPYYDSVDKLLRGLGTFQAISKLGYATSVANFSQMTNQIVRSGFENLFNSTSKYLGEKVLGAERTNYDLLSLSRRAWGDIAATAGHQPGGMIGWLGDMYMKAIGFPMTERIGRHIGAFGGDLEVQTLASRIAKAVNPKERGRLLSEIGRKYGVTEAMIGPAGELTKDTIERAAWEAARVSMHAFDAMELPLAWQDPTWKMILQFKSFIYKQSEFMFNEVAMPGIQWLATDGAKGDIMPLLRSMVVVPPMAELVTHGRDLTKSLPTRVVDLAKNYVSGDPLGKTHWKYKDPFWEDADPPWRVLSDAIYMGLFGIVGDMYESARMGRLADWLAGPTIGDIVDVGEAIAQRKGMGKILTQAIPGAVGIPYGADIFKEAGSFYQRMLREAARRGGGL